MSSEEWQIIGFTAWVSACSTLLILPFGLGMAWLLARRDWPGKSLVETFISLPLVMPPVATGLILLNLFGRRGPLGGWLHRHLSLDIIFTWRGVLLALGVMSFPLLVRSARVAFEEVSPRLEQIACTLGASHWRVFYSITLPLALRGIIGGMLLAFFERVQLGEDADAYRLLGVSVALAFVAVWGSEYLFGRKRRPA